MGLPSLLALAGDFSASYSRTCWHTNLARHIRGLHTANLV